MVFCTNCARNVTGVRPYDGHLCCPLCGKVLEDSYFSSEPQFVKDSSGQAKLSGQFVRSVQDGLGSRQRTLDRVSDELRYMKEGLNIDDYSDNVVEMALKFYEVALDRNLTKGRRTELVEAACLYLACREMEKPFLLIDFAIYLNINVYEIGAVYLQLCQKLYLADDRNGRKALSLVDPSIFIPKFTNALLLERNDEVVQTAKDIISSMKRDWMQTGRKPSGLCGAALYISVLSHGLKCSKSDIIKIMHVCEATLTKRLTEFENTESSSLTIEELREKEKELQSNFAMKPLSNSFRNSRLTEILCEHKQEKPYAYGLCERCYRKFMEVSGGLEGGSDPPAFQCAEKQRLMSLSYEENAGLKEESHRPFGYGHEKLEATSTDDYCANKPLDVDTEAHEESGSFSDIDDTEVDGYLHNEKEVQYRTIIWEEMNREYLEEQAAKEAAAAAARDAVMAQYDNCPEGLQAAKELAATAAAAVAKSRKERQQKRVAEGINSPAQTAAEATRRMLTRKGFSSKINYEALEKLFDESVGQDKVKKKRTESELHTDGIADTITEDHDIGDRSETDDVQQKDNNVDEEWVQESFVDDFDNVDEAYVYGEGYDYDGF